FRGMESIKETLSDMYYPSEIADLDFDLLHDLPYDFNLLGDDEDTPSAIIKQEHSPASSSEFAEICSFDPFNSVDSPPLTPPCMETMSQQINIENESNNNILLPNGTNDANSKFPKILPALKSSRGRSASHDSPDIQALKRHIRMIRNRESASLSRKKKKEYLSGLEGRVKELEIENAKLKQENCILKSKLSQFMGSSPLGTAKNIAAMLTTSKHKSLPSVTAKVALLGLFCFMFVTFQKPTLLSSSGNSTSHVMRSPIPARPIAIAHNPELQIFDSPGARTIRSKRSLLWEESVTNEIHWNDRKNDTTENITDDFVLTGRKKNEQFDNETLSSAQASKCPTLFNQTEAIRIQNDLKGIFSPKPRKKAPAKPIVYSLIDVSSNDNKILFNDSVSGLTIYDEKMRRFSRVLDQMQRRSDTFYVVSLAVENQLLLSAKSLNATSRPKMSFLMPWRNDTLGGKEELMQIDCEVTQVFNLNRQKRKRAQG
ncbi:unnamed protein product, partial [Allacma fusca]